jgi:hypothetical protein
MEHRLHVARRGQVMSLQLRLSLHQCSHIHSLRITRYPYTGSSRETEGERVSRSRMEEPLCVRTTVQHMERKSTSQKRNHYRSKLSHTHTHTPLPLIPFAYLLMTCVRFAYTKNFHLKDLKSPKKSPAILSLDLPMIRHSQTET